MDKAFLREVKEAALASGEWEEVVDFPLWIFPDGSGLASNIDEYYHGMLMQSLGLAHVPSDWHDNYHPAVHTLIYWGLVRVRNSGYYQVWDESTFPILEKYFIANGINNVSIEITSNGEYYECLDYEGEGDFSIAKAILARKRSGRVQIVKSLVEFL